MLIRQLATPALALGVIAFGSISATAADEDEPFVEQRGSILDNIYVGIHGAASVQQDVTATLALTGPDPDVLPFGPAGVTWGFDNPGFAFGGVLGYNFGNRFTEGLGFAFVDVRGELEFTFRDNGFDFALPVGAPGPGALADGDQQTFTGGANLWFDINTGTKFVPYIGGGISGTFIDFSFDPGADGVAPLFTGEQVEFSYQVGAGIDYVFDSGVRIGVLYRAFEFLSTDLVDGAVLPVGLGDTADFVDSDFNHTVGVQVTSPLLVSPLQHLFRR